MPAELHSDNETLTLTRHVEILTCKPFQVCFGGVQVYDEPTVLVAKRVTGEEEVPEGAVAVLTPDAPDVLSHVSVRARNMKVLFAICHEESTLKEVEDKEGTTISLQVGCCAPPLPPHPPRVPSAV